MNVLIFGEWDHGGCGNALMQAVNEHTEHRARQVCHETSYLQYPVDILKPTRHEMQDLWDWADVVNMHDSSEMLFPPEPHAKPLFVTYHGSQYRARWPYYNLFDHDRGWPQTTLGLDLSLFGPKWIPRPMRDLSWMREDYRGNGVFRVAHAPTNRALKDTEAVVDALSKLEGIEPVLVEHVSNEECLRIKASCHLFVDEFRLGYGINVVECFSLGVPALSHALPHIEGHIRHVLGKVPYVDTPLERLAETVTLLRDDGGLYRQAVTLGRECWEKFYKPSVVARRYIEFCERTAQGFNGPDAQE